MSELQNKRMGKKMGVERLLVLNVKLFENRAISVSFGQIT